MSGYRTVVADPPWAYSAKPNALRSGGRGASAEHHYPTMTNEDIAALSVADLVADDAHLYLWVTNPVLTRQRNADANVDAIDIVRAWGFKPKTIITWVKTSANGALLRGGTGWYFRGATEHVVFAVRGRAGVPAALREPNVVMAPRAGHSVKPGEFMALVERVSPSPRLEMFARAKRPGWDVWGNEVESVLSLTGKGGAGV